MKNSLVVLLLALVSGCSSGNGDLCESTFQPYPDLISGRQRWAQNTNMLDGMQQYAEGNFSAAIPLLEKHLMQPSVDPAPRLYLAVSYLAIGEPYQAELELDRLEQLKNNNFEDQVEWYNVLCLLCSEQHDRALELARELASQPRHSYKVEAAKLVSELE